MPYLGDINMDTYFLPTADGDEHLYLHKDGSLHSSTYSKKEYSGYWSSKELDGFFAENKIKKIDPTKIFNVLLKNKYNEVIFTMDSNDPEMDSVRDLQIYPALNYKYYNY